MQGHVTPITGNGDYPSAAAAAAAVVAEAMADAGAFAGNGAATDEAAVWTERTANSAQRLLQAPLSLSPLSLLLLMLMMLMMTMSLLLLLPPWVLLTPWQRAAQQQVTTGCCQ